MEFIIGLVVGAVGASIGWFFVWKNNKAKFSAVSGSVADLEKKLAEANKK